MSRIRRLGSEALIAGSTRARLAAHWSTAGGGHRQQPPGHLRVGVASRIDEHPGSEHEAGDRMESRPRRARRTARRRRPRTPAGAAGIRLIRHWVKRDPDKRRHQGEDGRQQDRDREFPDRVHVLDDPCVLAGALGELDRGRDAQHERGEQEQVPRVHVSRARSQAEGGRVHRGQHDDEGRQPVGQIPDRPGPERLRGDVHTFAHAGKHPSLLRLRQHFSHGRTIRALPRIVTEPSTPAVKTPLRTDTTLGDYRDFRDLSSPLTPGWRGSWPVTCP